MLLFHRESCVMRKFICCGNKHRDVQVFNLRDVIRLAAITRIYEISKLP